MMNVLRIMIFALIVMVVGLLTSNEAEALLPTHQCTFCHSLHGSSSTSSFVPQNSPTNIEVLCLGCHLTANGATAAVQPHRTGESDGAAGFTGNYYVTCRDCHNIHDNMPNWREGHSDAPDNDGSPPPNGWVEGTNAKMVGREDPDGVTTYAIIQTREADFDKNGIPDRGAAVTVECDELVQNDCYVQGKRHVIFENIDPTTSNASIHGFADDNEDGVDDTSAIGVASNISDSGFNMSPWDSVCQMCHSMTANHSLPTNKGTTHNSSRRCTDCHEHGFCFDRGNSCSKWTVPNRDVSVDLVTASPDALNPGGTTTVTVDVTNSGENVESFRVKYTSDIDGNLGWSTVTDLASDGSTQTTFDWTASSAGTHTLTAAAEILIGELNIANNSGTDIVTVQSIESHDVAVTSVTAPSPILQGATKTISVDIANPGTFTETFDVVLYDNTDDPGHASAIGTLSSGELEASGTTTLNFSWNTTEASVAIHTLEAIADTVASETITGNNSATTTSTVAVHDVSVTLVTAPATIDQGTDGSIDVDIINLSSSYSETFDVTLVSVPAGLNATTTSGSLAPGGSTTVNFLWDTTGVTKTTYTLTATAVHSGADGGTDANPGNDSASADTDVITPVTHDVEVTTVTAPATVDRGTSPTVTVRVTNTGGADETFDVTLSSDPDGTIQTLSSGTLAAGNFVDLGFTWVTDPASSLGLHTLTAVADTVPNETSTLDNTNSTTSTVTSHDVAVDLVTAPASTAQGGTAAVNVDITNEGSFTETFDVTLASDLDLTIQTLSSDPLGAGASTTLNFSWDTTGATIGTHTLTATADTVSGELDTADNAASTTSDVTGGVVHDVAVLSVTASPGTVKLKSNPSNVTISVVVENQGGATETFDISLVSDLDDAIDTLSSGALAAGAQTTIDFTWGVTSGGNTVGIHTLTATAATVAGESDTADNTGTGTIELK